jgi:hypothetical protein
MKNSRIRYAGAAWAAGLVAFWVGLGPSLGSAGQVHLVLETAKGAPITAMQEWGRDLREAKVGNVRMMQQIRPTKPTIETQDLGGQKLYTVRGTIDQDGNINLPGALFRMGDAGRLAQWLADVAEKGPPSEREPVDKYGLTLSTMKQVGVDLATPIDFETDGQTLAEIIRQVNRRTQYQILATKSVMAKLEKEKIFNEMKGFSAGTTLAYLSEPFGLGLYPSEGKNGKIQYLLVKRDTKQVEPWPVGWEPKQRRKTVPGLFEVKNINIDRISIEQVLKEIAKRVDVPYLVDETALAKQKIDMSKKLVSFPNKKTTFDRALGSMMSRSKLKYQLLLDDAGKPFLWVTPLGNK